MTREHESESDDLLSAWILQHPEVWDSGIEPSDPAVVEESVRRIVSGEHSARRAVEQSRRRRRAAAGGAMAVLLVAGGTVGVAALVRSTQTTRPNEGIVCRAAADLKADAVVIGFDPDPVAACAELWSAGEFAEAGAAPSIPELVSCIGQTGNIEVFPGGESLCGQLGLTVSDTTLTPDNDAIVRLADRLTNEINLAECSPQAAVTTVAQRILDESGVKGWTVVVRADSVGAACAKAAVDAPSRTVTIVKFP